VLDDVMPRAKNLKEAYNNFYVEPLKEDQETYYSLDDVNKAVEYYQQHLAIAREIGDCRREEIARWNMSLALHELDKPSESIKKTESSLEITSRSKARQ
jgi:tetratricopeptide (TPR) repeat protein